MVSGDEAYNWIWGDDPPIARRNPSFMLWRDMVRGMRGDNCMDCWSVY